MPGPSISEDKHSSCNFWLHLTRVWFSWTARFFHAEGLMEPFPIMRDKNFFKICLWIWTPLIKLQTVKTTSSVQKGYIAWTNWLYDECWRHILYFAILQTILQSDDVISTDPAIHDVVTNYEGPTMSHTKLWDIQRMWGPQHRGVMMRGNKMEKIHFMC